MRNHFDGRMLKVSQSGVSLVPLTVTQQHTSPSHRSYRADPVKAAVAESSGQESYIPLGDIREIGV